MAADALFPDFLYTLRHRRNRLRGCDRREESRKEIYIYEDITPQRGDKMKPYKIIVWGPGYLGAACIKEVLHRPEFELVGVLAYNEEKNNKDIGELLGIGSLGIKVTTDQEKIF